MLIFMAIEIEILESKTSYIWYSRIYIHNSIDEFVFYSLDGQDPSLDSLLADGSINMPTDGRSVMLGLLDFQWMRM